MGRRAYGRGEAAEVLKALGCHPSAARAAGAVLAAAVAATSPHAATEAIRRHMRELGTDADELAALLGKDPTTVRRWVREPWLLGGQRRGRGRTRLDAVCRARGGGADGRGHARGRGPRACRRHAERPAERRGGGRCTAEAIRRGGGAMPNYAARKPRGARGGR